MTVCSTAHAGALKARKHDILQVAFGETLKATYAHTLAECLYWSQYSEHEIDGRPAVYKTGPELSKVLGLNPRTLNRHLKELADKGYWSIHYKPRPRHPSPVSWLVIEDRGQMIVSLATQVGRSGNSDTRRGAAKEPSKGALDDVQASQAVTSFTVTPPDQETDNNSLVKGNSGKNELSHLSSQNTQGVKQVAVLPDLKELYQKISSSLSNNSLPGWDESSKFTWDHLAVINEKLFARGYESMDARAAIIEKIIVDWENLRWLMEPRYSKHVTNAHRPSPMALAVQLEILETSVNLEVGSVLSLGHQPKPNFLDQDFG